MSTLNFSCPSCGAEVKFKLRSSVFGVCGFCALMIVRHDLSLESFGKMVQMPVDMSPLQIGTQGMLDRDRFEIVGRRRVGWSAGFWNEWYLAFSSNKEGWLSDAQGNIMISFPSTPNSKLPPIQDIKPSSKILIDHVSYSVNDVLNVRTIASEGELPFKGKPDDQSISVDLMSGRDLFANLEIAEEETRFYIGKYFEFPDLKLQNLRSIDGW